MTDAQKNGPRILLTGFGPFGKAEVNPTQRLMEAVAAGSVAFAGAAVRAVVLDTAYAACEEQFRRAVAEWAPAAVLSFGLHMGTDELRLERIAVNVDDAAIADTGGLLRSGQRIAEDGPVGYWSTLPLEGMRRALEAAGIPVAVSNHAGTYVCNHLFYTGRHWIERRAPGTAMGFIHVPPFPEQVQGEAGRRGMALDVLVRAAQVCVAAVREALLQEAPSPPPAGGAGGA